LAPFADRIGIREELLEAFDARPRRRAPVWRDAARAALEGDLLAAADVLSRTGNVAWEAIMRFHAGEQLVALGRRAEGEAELRRAVDFYQSVGGSYFMHRAEALLSKTA
jgi:hypothetical protein